MASRVGPAVTRTLVPRRDGGGGKGEEASVGTAHPIPPRPALGRGGQPLADLPRQVLRLRQAAVADEAACQLAVGGVDDRHAVGAEGRHVALRGCVAPHVVVHRRGDEHGAPGREHDGGEHRVAEAAGQLRERLRRGRRDDHAVGPQAELDVLRPGRLRRARLGEQLAQHLALRQRRNRQRRDKAGRRRRHHRLDLRPGTDEPPHQVGRLVGGDAPRDAEDDLFAVERHAREGGVGDVHRPPRPSGPLPGRTGRPIESSSACFPVPMSPLPYAPSPSAPVGLRK